MVSISLGARPEADARAILNRHWQSDSRGRYKLPVDPIKIARDLDMEVYTADLAPDLAGLLVKRLGEDNPNIYLNRGDSEKRQRFTCAHEVGHSLRRSAGKSSGPWEFVDGRGQLAARGTDPEEIYANQFAAALLMPAALVQDLSDQYDKWDLARMFGVSDSAMEYRLVNLGLR